MTNKPDLWICEKKTHLPEHDGATGYFYYEPRCRYEVEKQNKWQDISSAPRDGTPFIALWPQQYHYPVVVFWEDKHGPSIGWKVMGWEHGKFSTAPFMWAPLPEPPSNEYR